MDVKKEVLALVRANKQHKESATNQRGLLGGSGRQVQSFEEHIVDAREFDVPYHMRVSIDTGIRCGLWYNVYTAENQVTVERYKELEARPELRVCAWDIECVKMALKFPDARVDPVMMISYMMDRRGYLIVNRQVVSADIDDFEYTPLPQFPGEFHIFNEPDEKALLRRFFDEIKSHRPNVYATYNGDGFDWPYVENRARAHGIYMDKEIGVSVARDGSFECRFAANLDCMHWVKRDSYLPHGSHGLKAVTKAKLGYDPVELDPERMTPLAKEDPQVTRAVAAPVEPAQVLASYSVSDAVATYYLYMKYVNPFIFSLATIIPMTPDEVLRKGTGGLCEALLMVEATNVNVIYPNKQSQDPLKLYKSHLLDSETYIGGHVEALECGVFRSDLNYKFRLDPEACQTLVDKLDRDLKFALTVEGGLKLEQVSNFDQVKQQIVQQLEELRDNPNREEHPLIYHLDVSAMYPNIILTNRLQPPAMVSPATCSACSFNPGVHATGADSCQRKMEWQWRGEYFPAGRSEYNQVKMQLESEQIPIPGRPGETIRFYQMTEEQQAQMIKKRMKAVSQRAYKKVHVTKTEVREDIVCQRENPFYVDTVQAFRDRRYVYKGLAGKWKRTLSDVQKGDDLAAVKEAENMVVLYDSLQLAHKCILNSFYGYVMRRGSRWYSMEMGGIVTHTGANIIKQARELVERLGRPLELDTDGIWCILPSSFPEEFTFDVPEGKKKKYTISYPCVMLNADVHSSFTNHQYLTAYNQAGEKVDFALDKAGDRDKQTEQYQANSECSIFFEVDGPYRAMILPAAREEGKLLKKRYAVFNEDGSLAELKGFELKRRGELQIIKFFQEQVFDKFLEGDTLVECYDAVASVANRWLDILYSQGAEQEDEELMELITENKTMSKSLQDMGEAKSTSVTSAQRLKEFLGDDMVKDAGLNCSYIISKYPQGEPVSNRAIPVAIFAAEPLVQKHFIRRWTKDSSRSDFDIRLLLDWDYYISRLDGTIQKIISIPAAIQSVPNPVPRSICPEWLQRSVREKQDKRKQRSITSMFSKAEQPAPQPMDIEDTLPGSSPFARAAGLPVQRRSAKKIADSDEEDEPVLAKRSRRPRQVIEEEEEVQPAEPQSQQLARVGKPPRKIADGFPAWLLAQKQKWRAMREEESGARLWRGDLMGHFKGQAEKISKREWQILHVSERERSPGVFTLWAVIGGTELQGIPLEVPRVLYINSYVPNEELEQLPFVTKVSKELPHAHTAHHLYQLELNEQLYRENIRVFDGYRTHPEVEGVYEGQVPLELRAVMHVGIACRVARGRGAPSDPLSGVRLDQLESCPHNTAESHYLHGATGPDGWLNQLYVYHVHCAELSMVAVVALDQAQGTVVLLNPAQRAGPATEMRRLFAATGIKVSCFVESDPEAGYRRAQAALAQYHQRQRGPMVAVLQSSRSLKYLRESMLPGLADMPVVAMTPHLGDSEFPQLGWQEFTCKNLANRLGSIDEWWTEKLDVSKYSQIPIGNLQADVPCNIADTFFARKLSQQNHVLWVSPSRLPDLGGGPLDGNQLLAETISCSEVSVPGAYRSICVELLMSGSTVEALMSKQLLDEMDGMASIEAINTAETREAEQQTRTTPHVGAENERAACSHTLRILRNLVQGWMLDVGKTKNEFSDMMLMHLFRWIQNPAALLHDPALHRVVHALTQRLFEQLVTELKGLGAQIVYAGVHSVVVCTGKTDLNQAEGYMSYILDTIKQHELFGFVELSVGRTWQSLLWMDQANHGGLQLEQGAEPGSQEALRVESNWNIGEYLPPAVAHDFLVLISEFIYVQLRSETAPPAEDGSVPTIPTLREHFAPTLLPILDQIAHTDPATLYQDPSGTSSHLDLLRATGAVVGTANPSLEFAKFFCHVLSLDKSFEHDAMLLRRSALKMLHVREFAPEAQFRNPCVSFLLPNHVCSFCNLNRDLDLCRDVELLAHNWQCPSCGQPYDKPLIEMQLVEISSRINEQYQLQDLKCASCGLPKRDSMGLHCHCSGELVLQQPVAEKAEQLRVLHGIARYHEFEWLQESTEWLLELPA